MHFDLETADLVIPMYTAVSCVHHYM